MKEINFKDWLPSDVSKAVGGLTVGKVALGGGVAYGLSKIVGSAVKGGSSAASSGGILSGLGTGIKTLGSGLAKVIAPIGAVLGGYDTYQSVKEGNYFNAITSGLMTAGSLAAMVPGGQLVGAGLAGVGALGKGAKYLWDNYSLSGRAEAATAPENQELNIPGVQGRLELARLDEQNLSAYYQSLPEQSRLFSLRSSSDEKSERNFRLTTESIRATDENTQALLDGAKKWSEGTDTQTDVSSDIHKQRLEEQAIQKQQKQWTDFFKVLTDQIKNALSGATGAISSRVKSTGGGSSGSNNSSSYDMSGGAVNLDEVLDRDVTKDSGVTADTLNQLFKGGVLEGMGQDFLDIGHEFGIDPAFLAAITKSENNYGHDLSGILGHEGSKHNVMSILDANHNPEKYDMGSYRENIREMAKQLRRYYIEGASHGYDNRRTARQIQEIYCPSGAEGGEGWLHNIPTAYADMQRIQGSLNGVSRSTRTSNSSGNMPLYNQGDPRWSSKSYGNYWNMGYSGCTPTSIAMMASWAKGREITPDMVGDLNPNWSILDHLNRFVGDIDAREFAGREDASYAYDMLGKGHKVMSYWENNQGAIDRQYTRSGNHAVMWDHVNPDGTIHVFDPNGGREWDASLEDLMTGYQGQTHLYVHNGQLPQNGQPSQMGQGNMPILRGRAPEGNQHVYRTTPTAYDPGAQLPNNRPTPSSRQNRNPYQNVGNYNIYQGYGNTQTYWSGETNVPEVHPKEGMDDVPNPGSSYDGSVFHVGVHPGEMILPRWKADIVRRGGISKLNANTSSRNGEVSAHFFGDLEDKLPSHFASDYYGQPSSHFFHDTLPTFYNGTDKVGGATSGKTKNKGQYYYTMSDTRFLSEEEFEKLKAEKKYSDSDIRFRKHRNEEGRWVHEERDKDGNWSNYKLPTREENDAAMQNIIDKRKTAYETMLNDADPAKRAEAKEWLNRYNQIEQAKKAAEAFRRPPTNSSSTDIFTQAYHEVKTTPMSKDEKKQVSDRVERGVQDLQNNPQELQRKSENADRVIDDYTKKRQPVQQPSRPTRVEGVPGGGIAGGMAGPPNPFSMGGISVPGTFGGSISVPLPGRGGSQSRAGGGRSRQQGGWSMDDLPPRMRGGMSSGGNAGGNVFTQILGRVLGGGRKSTPRDYGQALGSVIGQMTKGGIPGTVGGGIFGGEHGNQGGGGILGNLFGGLFGGKSKSGGQGKKDESKVNHHGLPGLIDQMSGKDPNSKEHHGILNRWLGRGTSSKKGGDASVSDVPKDAHETDELGNLKGYTGMEDNKIQKGDLSPVRDAKIAQQRKDMGLGDEPDTKVSGASVEKSDIPKDQEQTNADSQNGVSYSAKAQTKGAGRPGDSLAKAGLKMGLAGVGLGLLGKWTGNKKLKKFGVKLGQAGKIGGLLGGIMNLGAKQAPQLSGQQGGIDREDPTAGLNDNNSPSARVAQQGGQLPSSSSSGSSSNPQGGEGGSSGGNVQRIEVNVSGRIDIPGVNEQNQGKVTNALVESLKFNFTSKSGQGRHTDQS